LPQPFIFVAPRRPAPLQGSSAWHAALQSFSQIALLIRKKFDHMIE
jgi:hypothetical protein